MPNHSTSGTLRTGLKAALRGLIALAAIWQLPATPVRSAPTGLVAAYGFNEGLGTWLNDASGNGNDGAIAGATWTASGKFGGALSFDGINDWVTITDSDSLDLTNGMTLEAWVKPTSSAAWRSVILKETTGGLAYSAYSHNDRNRPAGYVHIGGSDVSAAGTASLPLNSWSHLAVTYNGSVLRIYVNGAQKASRSVGGALTASAGPLRLGGNSVWGEYFAGLIDEIRIYNRALSATEIQSDMNAAVAGDTTAPIISSVTSSAITDNSATILWTTNEPSDSVVEYGLTTSYGSSTPLNTALVTSHSTGLSGLSAGTLYHYRVKSRDGAQNVAVSPDNVLTTSAPDTTPPVVTLTSPQDYATLSAVIPITADASG